jgi:hypothetical protein
MADLFLSYAHQDTKRAKTVAKLLEDAGLTVWWDRRMVAGGKIHDVVDEEIEKAKAVIVLWSRFSVKSDWVLGEAQTAQESAKLVPIKIAACKLPVNYRGIHTPAVYKGKSELDELARMLSDKFRTALPLPRGATEEPSKARSPTRRVRDVDPKITIEFTNESSVNFLMKLSVVSFSIWFITTIGASILHRLSTKADWEPGHHGDGGHHDGGHFDGGHFDGGDGGHH